MKTFYLPKVSKMKSQEDISDLKEVLVQWLHCPVNVLSVKSFVARGWAKIIWTDILLHIPKTIAPRVKNQARGQNKWSRALKWGIVRFCSLNAFGDTTKFMKMWVF